ncbi:hypothetical protein C1H46_015337 [Malus baccata]|uniref:Uncharacterized protein n=1 Tax=Malus baccata TaxID=106549 RepID=A0A540MJW0_MALBA|nr:hypothetical protein C1H46_015337 [Malus baccata]
MNSVFSSWCLFVPLPSCQFLPCFQTQPRHMLITMSLHACRSSFAVPLKLDEVFETLGRCFTPGARLVISHPQGREVLEQQRRQYPDVITSDLPEKSTLEEAAAEHSFELTKFVDEPGFYLAVLKFVGARNW